MIDVEAEIARMEAELKHKEGLLAGRFEETQQ